MEVFLEEPVQINEGQSVSIMSKTKCTDSNRYFYGYDGYENYLEKIEGQDPTLFKMKYSNSN
jgi:hypothetical protein